MMSEFYDRTKYEPSFDEYRYIEDSYYEFNGDKNAFCKWWLKAKKSGEWEKELKLRKRLDEVTSKMAAELMEKEENLEFYRPYFDRACLAEGILSLLDRSSVSFNLRMKDEPTWRHYKSVQVQFHKTAFEFINVIEESGWITSFKVNKIDTICDIKN